jgi:hypothetical protein
MTTAASVASGQLLEQAGQEQQGHDRERGDDEPGHLALGAGTAVDSRLREAAVHDHAARQARSEIRGTHPEQLAVGVDLVVVAGSVGLGRSKAFCKADQDDAGGAAGELEVLLGTDVGQPQRRQAAVDVPDDRDAVRLQIEGVDSAHAERDRHQRTRDDWQETPQSHDDREGDEADDERTYVGVAKVPHKVPELLEEVAAALLDAEQLGKLAHDDREREPDDEPLEHRLRDEVGDEAQPQQAGDHGDDARRDRERRRQRDELARAGGRELGHGGGGERGRRGHGTGDQVPRAAEGGVQDQRARRGVQPDHRRRARDARVCERLGHEHRPYRQARDRVAAEPLGAIAAQRPERPQRHGGHRGRVAVS